jgi:ABC-2 type transport system permease protein
MMHRIIESLRDCAVIWRHELQHVGADIGVVIFFIIVPLVYPLLYGVIYNTEAMHDTPLIVVDESHSAAAREFARRIDATADVQVYAYATSMDEARTMETGRRAFGILHIPADFSARINRGEQATVGLYADMSGLLFYKALLLSTTEASLTMGEYLHPELREPIKVEAVSLYNSQNGFASFLLPAILILIIQQTLLLGAGMMAATHRELHGGRLLPMENMHNGTLRIVVGKALAYLSIYVGVCVWALVVVPKIFNIPHPENYGTLLLFSLPYLLACIFWAMTIATFVRGREMPMMIFVFSSLILLFMSGISWPQSAIPNFWKYISWLFPSTFGIQGFVKINSMGAGLWNVAFEYRMLWIQTAVYFLATFAIYKLQKSRQS